MDNRIRKLLALSLALALALSLAACVRAQEVYQTGLGVVTSLSRSKPASADADGVAEGYSTVAAVLLDGEGRIAQCIIDVVQSQLKFSNEGKIVTDLGTQVKSKNELGDAYGMRAASAIGKEWYEQAAAFAASVIGKTAGEVATTPMDETGKPTEPDVLAGVTVTVTDMVAAVVKAAGNAQAQSAGAGDALRLATTTDVSGSTDATAEKAGLARAYNHYFVVTVNGEGKVTSAIIDALQADVKFDTAGQITSDIQAAVATKNELGDAYGMKAASSIGKEWNEQAAAFAAYAVGKTADEIAATPLTGEGAAAPDVVAGVTVHASPFIEGLVKAAKA